jgi:hypothetical protein
MKKLLLALLAMVFWAPAMALAPLEYKLVVDSCVVTSSEPYAPPGSPCNARTLDALDGTFVVLHSSPAAFEYVQHNGVVSSVSDTGFEQIVVPYNGGVRQIYPPSLALLCVADCDLKVTASDFGASVLDAVFAVNTGIDTFTFSGNSGRLLSDVPFYGGAFTGHLVPIPEPPSWALMIAASLALVIVRIALRHPSRRIPRTLSPAAANPA